MTKKKIEGAIPVSKFAAIQVDYYKEKETYSLLNCSIDIKTGEVFQNWAKYELLGKPNDKSWPVKVGLGKKEQALAALKEAIRQIEEDDIPREL